MMRSHPVVSLLIALTLSALTLSAFAADQPKRAAPQIDPITGKRLNEAIEFINASKYAEAKATLEKLNMDHLSPYERSRVEEMYASIANSQSDYDGTRKHLEAAIATGGMNDEEISNARFQIAELYLAQDQWAQGIDALKQWFATATNPNSNAYYLLAVAYYRMDNKAAALEPAQKAVELSDQPQPAWVELLVALLIEREQYEKSIPFIKYLITQAPDKRTNWIQLAGVYRELERYDDALAVNQVAYVAGLTTTASDIKTLADLQAFAGIPYRGARLLSASIADKRVDADGKTWEKLAYMWIGSRDYKKAMDPLEKAAGLSDNGNLYVRIAELDLRDEAWPAAVDALQRAFAKGGLKDPGNSQLLLGIALYNANHVSDARAAFSKAKDFAKVRDQADAWIRHIDSTSS
jgi:Tfp pilus assembly protein PilF